MKVHVTAHSTSEALAEVFAERVLLLYTGKQVICKFLWG